MSPHVSLPLSFKITVACRSEKQPADKAFKEVLNPLPHAVLLAETPPTRESVFLASAVQEMENLELENQHPSLKIS